MYLLFKNLGVRWLVAVLAWLPLTLFFRLLASICPPPGFAEWPSGPRGVVLEGAELFNNFAFGLWLSWLLGLVVWRVSVKHAHLNTRAQVYVAVAIAIANLASIALMLYALSTTPGPYFLPALWGVFYAAVVPCALGAIPLLLVELHAWSQTIAWLRHFLYAGRGAHADWIAPYALRRDTRPIPEALP